MARDMWVHYVWGCRDIFDCNTYLLCCIPMAVSEKFASYTSDPKTAPYMGCLSMGYNTLVNFLYFLTENWAIGIFVLWWISVILALYTAFIVFYSSFLAKQKSKSNYLDPKIYIQRCCYPWSHLSCLHLQLIYLLLNYPPLTYRS